MGGNETNLRDLVRGNKFYFQLPAKTGVPPSELKLFVDQNLSSFELGFNRANLEEVEMPYAEGFDDPNHPVLQLQAERFAKVWLEIDLDERTRSILAEIAPEGIRFLAQAPENIGRDQISYVRDSFLFEVPCRFQNSIAKGMLDWLLNRRQSGITVTYCRFLQEDVLRDYLLRVADKLKKTLPKKPPQTVSEWRDAIKIFQRAIDLLANREGLVAREVDLENRTNKALDLSDEIVYAQVSRDFVKKTLEGWVLHPATGQHIGADDVVNLADFILNNFIPMIRGQVSNLTEGKGDSEAESDLKQLEQHLKNIITRVAENRWTTSSWDSWERVQRSR